MNVVSVYVLSLSREIELARKNGQTLLNEALSLI